MKTRIILNLLHIKFSLKNAELIQMLAADKTIELTDIVLFFDTESNLQSFLPYIQQANVQAIQITEYNAEPCLQVLENLCKQSPTELIVFPDDLFGKELSVRLSYRLEGNALIGVKNLKIHSKKILCERDTYSNHQTSIIEVSKLPLCITLVPQNYEVTTYERQNNAVHIDNSMADSSENGVEILSKENKNLDDAIETAPLVIVLGMGVQNKEELAIAKENVTALGAKYGVTRPVAMSGYSPIDDIIGASGKILQSKLCLVLGASGASAFLKGIENCKHIIAVNTDDTAQIRHCSDVFIKMDYKKFLDELSACFKENQK